ncbi:hypothetical protein ACFUAC_36575 [Streptomyces sp. NPDC057148]|uniref:hypothetical protein n=1 Tax=unclassified Streptomyces TaxID=2593676 RepID=UPI0036374CA8
MSRKLAALTAVGVLALVPLAPSAAGAVEAPSASRDIAVAHHRAGPVGVWSGTVAAPTGEIEAEISFRANGELCLIAPPPGPEGGVEGQGTWWRTGPRTFTFEVEERFFDGSGSTTGYLRATHRATLRGNQFTTVGEGAFYDAAGQEQDSFPVTSRMNRRSGTCAC